jgi:hypothetical protein
MRVVAASFAEKQSDEAAILHIGIIHSMAVLAISIVVRVLRSDSNVDFSEVYHSVISTSFALLRGGKRGEGIRKWSKYRP